MFTNHAVIRCQQRGIRQDVVNAIFDYGQRGHHRGAQVYFMDKKARRLGSAINQFPWPKPNGTCRQFRMGQIVSSSFRKLLDNVQSRA